MRSRRPLFIDPALYTALDAIPQWGYRRHALRKARHHMELIAGVMILLAALLAGWSAHQASLWRSRAIAESGQAGNPLADALRIDREAEMGVRELRDSLATMTGTPIAADGTADSDRDQRSTSDLLHRQDAYRPMAETGVLPLPQESTAAALIAQSQTALVRAQRSNDTASRYLMAAGMFALALLCAVGSLRRVATTTTQMTALLATEVLILAGFWMLGVLPAAIGI